MASVKISIVTAVHNRCDTIAATLASVRAQSHPDVEHIVVDGASSDGTTDILRAQRAQIDFLVSEPDNGIYDALNKGIAAATGEVIGLLHADDVYANERVLSTVARVFEDEKIDAVYGDLEYVSKNDVNKTVRFWKAGEFSPAKLSWGWMPPHPTFFARRAVYERLGRFDTSYRIAADYDLILRFLGRAKLSVAYIPEVLIKMRVGGISNRSLANIFRKSREDFRALRCNQIGGIGSLAWKNFGKLSQFLVRR
jgi:glycosyltransferase involved in cell wall biosynthesis